jgi:hypothetical protein
MQKETSLSLQSFEVQRPPRDANSFSVRQEFPHLSYGVDELPPPPVSTLGQLNLIQKYK